MPPERGNIAASSEYTSAPKRERRPPTTQSQRISAGLPISFAIWGGVWKMPLPMMMPTMIADPPQNPIRRGRSPDMRAIQTESRVDTKRRRTRLLPGGRAGVEFEPFPDLRADVPARLRQRRGVDAPRVGQQLR